MEWRAHVSDEYRAWAQDALTVQFTRRHRDGTEQIVGFDERGEPITTIVDEGMTPAFPGFMIPRDAVHALAEHIKPGPSQGEVKRLEQALEIERRRVDQTLAPLEPSTLETFAGCFHDHDPSGVDAQLDAIHLMLRQQHRALDARLARIERAINSNTVNDTLNTEALMADFTDLHAEVEANGDAVDSAVTLLNTLSTQLADAADDPDEIRSIAEALSAQSEVLAAAVTANTPAAPEPTPEPVGPTPEG